MEPIFILQGITLDQLMYRIEGLMEKKIAEKQQQLQNAPSVRKLTRKEAAEYLRVSLPTIHDWTKQGLLKSDRIGSRVFFKSNVVDESLRERKYNR